MVTFEQDSALMNQFVDALKVEALATGFPDPGGNAYISAFLTCFMKSYMTDDLRGAVQRYLSKMQQEQQK